MGIGDFDILTYWECSRLDELADTRLRKLKREISPNIHRSDSKPSYASPSLEHNVEWESDFLRVRDRLVWLETHLDDARSDSTRHKTFQENYRISRNMMLGILQKLGLEQTDIVASGVFYAKQELP